MSGRLLRRNVAQSVQWTATDWTIRRSNPGGGEIFRTRPDRLWRPPRLINNGYRVSFPEVKRPGRGVDYLLRFRAEAKERVELYLYSPSGPSWPVTGWTLPLPLWTQWMYYNWASVPTCRRCTRKANKQGCWWRRSINHAWPAATGRMNDRCRVYGSARQHVRHRPVSQC